MSVLLKTTISHVFEIGGITFFFLDVDKIMLWSFCSVTWKHWSKPSRPLALTFIWWRALLTAAAPICGINYPSGLEAHFFSHHSSFSPFAFLTMGICQLEAVKGEFKGGNRPLGTDGLWHPPEHTKALRCLFSPNIEFLFLGKQNRLKVGDEWIMFE